MGKIITRGTISCCRNYTVCSYRHSILCAHTFTHLLQSLFSSLGSGHILHFPFVSIQCGFLQNQVQQIHIEEEFKILNRLSCLVKTWWYNCFALNILHWNCLVQGLNQKPETSHLCRSRYATSHVYHSRSHWHQHRLFHNRYHQI